MLVDLALPRDVEIEVGELPGQVLVGLGELGDTTGGAAAQDDAVLAEVRAVRELVESEVAGFEILRRQREVAPTVTALRRAAGEIVEAEMGLLDRRLPELDEGSRAEVARTVHRIVDKMLHTLSLIHI